jgi:hypothetical protein
MVSLFKLFCLVCSIFIMFINIGCSKKNEDFTTFKYTFGEGYKCPLEYTNIDETTYYNLQNYGDDITWALPADENQLKKLITILDCFDFREINCHPFFSQDQIPLQHSCIVLKSYEDPSGNNPIFIDQSNDGSIIMVNIILRIDYDGQQIEIKPMPIIALVTKIPDQYFFVVTAEM